MLKMHFDAIIFDLDGTLLNTLDAIADSANAVLGSRRYPVFAVEEYKMLVGDGVWTLMRRVVPDEEQTPELITECVTQLRDEYSRRWSSKTRPYDGISRMLDDLSDRHLKLSSQRIHITASISRDEIRPNRHGLEPDHIF